MKFVMRVQSSNIFQQFSSQKLLQNAGPLDEEKIGGRSIFCFTECKTMFNNVN